MGVTFSTPGRKHVKSTTTKLKKEYCSCYSCVSSCEHGNEPWGSINIWAFLHKQKILSLKIWSVVWICMLWICLFIAFWFLSLDLEHKAFVKDFILLQFLNNMAASVVQWSQFLVTDLDVRVRFPALPDFLEVVLLKWRPLILVSKIEELLGRRNRGSGIESREYGVRIRRTEYATPYNRNTWL
jgi:hypothetical protein